MFKFVGDAQRVFPDCGLIVNPGDVVDVCPDPVFFEPVVTEAAAKAEETK